MARFYDPDSGSVRVDGVGLRDLILGSISRHLGVVFQDTSLFHTSVRDNLPQHVRRRARQRSRRRRWPNMDGLVRSLPDGYDTVVGERGHRLSGGEKQRIATARVVPKGPSIVALDEATSNLDAQSEQLIQAALRRQFAGRTSLVIPHRLSTILAADVAMVLQEGRLADHGTHAELLERGGPYRTLYERQLNPRGEAASSGIVR